MACGADQDVPVVREELFRAAGHGAAGWPSPGGCDPAAGVPLPGGPGLAPDLEAAAAEGRPAAAVRRRGHRPRRAGCGTQTGPAGAGLSRSVFRTLYGQPWSWSPSMAPRPYGRSSPQCSRSVSQYRRNVARSVGQAELTANRGADEHPPFVIGVGLSPAVMVLRVADLDAAAGGSAATSIHPPVAESLALRNTPSRIIPHSVLP